MKQRVQNVMRAFASVIARAQAGGVVGRELQQVERDALRGLRTDAGQPAQLVDQVLDRSRVDALTAEAAAAEPPMSTPPERAGLELLHLVDGVVERGEHEVLEHLDVVGVDRLGRDRDRLEVHRRGDR